MFEDVLAWSVIGLLVINLIALNNWHRVMHVHIQELARTVKTLNRLFLFERTGIITLDEDTADEVPVSLVEQWDNADL